MEYAVLQKKTEDGSLTITEFRNLSQELDPALCRTIDGFPAMRPVVNKEPPPFDPLSQRLSSARYKISAGFVERFYDVEDLDASAVADRLVDHVRSLPKVVRAALRDQHNRLAKLEGGQPLTEDQFESYLARLLV